MYLSFRKHHFCQYNKTSKPSWNKLTSNQDKIRRCVRQLKKPSITLEINAETPNPPRHHQLPMFGDQSNAQKKCNDTVASNWATFCETVIVKREVSNAGYYRASECEKPTSASAVYTFCEKNSPTSCSSNALKIYPRRNDTQTQQFQNSKTSSTCSSCSSSRCRSNHCSSSSSSQSERKKYN